MKELEEVKEDWFSTWFNSPYYHLLYKSRDYKEAKKFIDNLDTYFKWSSDDVIMDLACGKGRHSIYLNQKGSKVIGLDLSKQNILYARSFENERLKFSVHDMRDLYAKESFTHVVNLFTSFGYFSSDEDNYAVFNSVYNSLKAGGYLLIDYMNPDKVINELLPYEEKIIEGTKFTISKRVENGFIIKDISFSGDGRVYDYQERVQILREEHFKYYFEKVGFLCKAIFGDYDLNTFDFKRSDRMIFVAKKPSNDN